MKQLIIGSNGEVGSALVSIFKKSFKEIYECDVNTILDKKIKYDIIHITFPYSEYFSSYVLDYALQFGIKEVIVIIHSTVLPNTTKDLSNKINNVIYSAIRGKHPNLITDLLKYTKYFASEFTESLDITERIFKIAGFKTKIVNDCTSLEFAKHYSTLLFGLSLIATQEIYEAKKEFNINPGIIKDFVNEVGKYSGDRKIFQYIEKIGGHCVIENAILFQKYSNLAKYVIMKNKKFGDKYKDKYSLE
ncbi:hypothetical protein LCGC14_0800680 [marine sediment metagenome]|uniref:Uncharacterized protein n=1 Tax=marine sediment metagenome TaxID=412755 RepID=A0A0F9PU97_9ZZZZ